MCAKKEEDKRHCVIIIDCERFEHIERGTTNVGKVSKISSDNNLFNWFC